MDGTLNRTYGLWKDEYVLGGNDDPDNEKSDVRRNEEINFPYMSAPKFSYYKFIDKKGLDNLNSFTNKYCEFGALLTCSDWSSQAFFQATGVVISPANAVGIGTPKAISQSIKSIGANTVLNPAK